MKVRIEPHTFLLRRSSTRHAVRGMRGRGGHQSAGPPTTCQVQSTTANTHARHAPRAPAPRTHDTHARTHARDHTQRSTVRREKQVGSITSYHIMSVDDKWKEGNKLLLLVRGDLEQLETGKDTSVFLQGVQPLPLLLFLHYPPSS